MNKLSRFSASIDSQASPFRVRTSLFHCTPVLERRRRTHWDYKFNQHSKRFRKQSLFRNVSDYAENLFQGSRGDWDGFEQSSGRGSSWFRVNFREGGNKRGKPRSWASQASRRKFEFCDDFEDVEFETIFRSAFGGSRCFYWSFTMDGEPQFRASSNSYRMNNNWNYEYGDEYDASSRYNRSMPNVTSDRLALGLSASGPLNLEDVKNAYRACALKWHPDRHQGSSKAVAEEKFKVCSAAYKSLCDKLSLQ